MKSQTVIYRVVLTTLIFCCLQQKTSAQAVSSSQEANAQFKTAADKVEKGILKNNTDTLAQGYFDLGESYYQKGDLLKSEANYMKAKALYEKSGDADKIAKSSRALAQVQEDLHKTLPALANYNTARINNLKTGDTKANMLNTNDAGRLSKKEAAPVQEKLLLDNITLSKENKDTNEVVAGYNRMAQMSNGSTINTVNAYQGAFDFSQNNPQQALKFNQLIADQYVKDKNYRQAIQTKEQVLKQDYVQSSSQLKAGEINSLADIYILKKDDSNAIRLLNESYALSVRNGHTLEAKRSLEKLDSIYRTEGKKDKSLDLYKSFLSILPSVIEKDSSLVDNKLVAETEEKIKSLENERISKNALIRKKNVFTYWLIGFIAVLAVFTGIILSVVKKLKIRNKKIALQSLRREMNPHFIFNSLNSINQFISNNNELEANRYLTKFSTLMRKVMENSKEDFVSFSDEKELLQNYLELEKSRFPDKFDFAVKMDDALYANEQFFIPGMLIQPHLENAIWHGLRYLDKEGFLELKFSREKDMLHVTVTDNGIGMIESRKNKTVNQKSHSGRGIKNTLERIRILNELYRQQINCTIEERPLPERGVVVRLSVPLLKDIKREN